MIKPIIEKDIPVTPQERARGSKWAWLSDLEVGDSFSCSRADAPRVGAAVDQARKSGWLPEQYRISRRPEGEDSYRVWRVS
jgi:hypothetical protein